MKIKHALILSLFITLLIANSFYFHNLIKNENRKTVLVTRIIDGDTIVVDNETNLRLLNINTPEKGTKGSEEAKQFISKFLNKQVDIEEKGYDKYSRVLARVYTPDYLNLKIIEEGFATNFLVDDSEVSIFAEAEKNAIENEKGIWKRSPYFDCIESKIFPEKEFIILKNKCQKINIKNWTITDESRKKYKFKDIYLSTMILHSKKGEDNSTDVYWQSKDSIWNDNRDTLYIYDSQRRIVHYEAYGY